MARVTLNGHDLGTLWKPPYCVDITDAAKVGDNALEIQVVNLWPNRMIGDEQMPEDSERNADGTLKAWPQWLNAGQPSPTGRYTFTSWRLWKKDDALLPSGLLGPVTLRQQLWSRCTNRNDRVHDAARRTRGSWAARQVCSHGGNKAGFSVRNSSPAQNVRPS